MLLTGSKEDLAGQLPECSSTAGEERGREKQVDIHIYMYISLILF